MSHQRGLSTGEAVKLPHSVSLKVLRYIISSSSSTRSNQQPDSLDPLSPFNTHCLLLHPPQSPTMHPQPTQLPPPPSPIPPPLLIHSYSLRCSLFPPHLAPLTSAKHSAAPSTPTMSFSLLHPLKRQSATSKSKPR